MTVTVRFVTGVPDPIAWAERAVRRAHGQGIRLWVVGSPPDLLALERRLCVNEPLGFVPFAGAGAASAVRRRSALQLLDAREPLPSSPAGTRLLNLAAEVPGQAGLFDEVFDCASTDPEALAQARQRFRAYQAQGMTVVHTTSRAAGARADSP